MSIESGKRFGPYEVVEQIGSGGMGEVWRATDTTLKRDVALKVLPKAFVEDADRLSRFQREAEILASLNHPNIATIHGLEQSDDQTVIVMELVDGPTLEERIKEGPLSPDEAMGIALQIVAALEAAHEKQIVHRDLKPANVKVRKDGTVKVLDFGISKPIDPATISGGVPVAETPAVTQTGVILGTAAYMSPEQAQGKFVDQRTDIWAFGCLLFEMLTGQPAFGGENVMAILARVIDRDTDLSSMPGTISPAVRRTIGLCLEKDARRRIADIRDVRLALAGTFETSAAVSTEAPVLAGVSWRAAVAAALALAVVSGLGAWWLKPGASAPPLTRSLLSDSDANFVPSAYDLSLAVAPDGSRMVYRGVQDGQAQMFTRRLDELDTVSLAENADVRGFFFSPDGRRIGYTDSFAIYHMAAEGGSVTTVFDGVDGATRGATWAPDNSIIFASSGVAGLLRVPAGGGGQPEILTTPDTEAGENHVWPQILPGGDALLFTIASAPFDSESSRIAAMRLDGSSHRTLIQRGSSPRYVSSGYIVYAVGTTLYAAGFDRETLELTTDSYPVVEDVHVTQTGASSFGVSNDGSLIYVRGDVNTGRLALHLVSQDGADERLPFDPADYSYPHLSPDGRRITVSVASQDVYVGNLRSGLWSPLTTSPAPENVPIWTPDSESIVFASQRENAGRYAFLQQSADGIGEAVRLLRSDQSGGHFKPYRFTADGTALLFDYGPPNSLNIGILNLSGDEDWRPLIASDALESTPSLSRDGDWIAFTTNVNGRCEVYAQRFPEPGGRTPIAIGTQPLFSPTRDELYYRDGPLLVAVPIDFDNGISPGPRRVIADGLPSPVCYWHDYDISADGETFVILRPAADEGGVQGADIVLVQNWVSELERLVRPD